MGAGQRRAPCPDLGVLHDKAQHGALLLAQWLVGGVVVRALFVFVPLPVEQLHQRLVVLVPTLGTDSGTRLLGDDQHGLANVDPSLPGLIAVDEAQRFQATLLDLVLAAFIGASGVRSGGLLPRPLLRLVLFERLRLASAELARGHPTGIGREPAKGAGVDIGYNRACLRSGEAASPPPPTPSRAVGCALRGGPA